MSEPVTHCGYAAVIGAPNAGKSTLINTLVGAKVSIVSPKVQTTRTRVMGIVMHDGRQIIFVDTPGIFQASEKNALERAMKLAQQPYEMFLTRSTAMRFVKEEHRWEPIVERYVKAIDPVATHFAGAFKKAG